MSKRIFLLAIVFCALHTLHAQDYIVQGMTPNLHLDHKVAARETWYSIGRMYNLPAKDIALYNKLNAATPLEIGQDVQIPLTTVNFSQNDTKSGGEAFVPVYHVVQPKEWLYRISVNYNKVPVETLQKWNSIGKDGAKPGTKLIIGYLKVKDANVALAPRSPQLEEPKAPALKADTPSKVTASAKIDSEPKTPEPVSQANAATPEGRPIATNKDGSYFKSLFEDTGKSGSGITGIFKSASGWNDGKYYALMSSVPVGTILKITYPATNKSVYAKVLGELPEMKESAGLGLRISDAAAYELGSPESKFSVNLKY